jgi:DNA repair exonuclease SbcCD ATPase subunit
LKLLKGTFENFGSYKHLEFDFSQLGLALAFGKTGSGKSTLPDMVAWTLYGQTAKDGSVDDVRSWSSPGELTTGSLEVETSEGSYIVTRKRGKSATANDLYWVERDSTAPVRGKDMADTQKLLEKRLGVSAELYFVGVYFHEFSATGLFFTANAKSRRATFERIASLDLAVRLGNVASDERKSTKRDLLSRQSTYANVSGRTISLGLSCVDSRARAVQFDETLLDRIKEYEEKSNAFEKTKKEKIAAAELRAEKWDADRQAKIDALKAIQERLAASIEDPNVLLQQIDGAKKLGCCSTCKQPLKEYQDKIDKLKAKLAENERFLDKFDTGEQTLQTFFHQENPYLEAVETAKREENTYSLRIADEKKKPNPFKAQVAKLEKELEEATKESDAIGTEIAALETKISNLTALYDISFELRGELLKQAVQDVQDSTNRYLEKFFDSEIRVGFALEGSDDLTVSIQKSGYDCVYKQLSRGQRALLRLCFVVSIMKGAANRAGVHFDNLFYDEVLDGLDGDLKIKAFALFEELSTEHSSILLIDHASEFQNLFTRRFHVTMEADTSSVEEEHE